MVSRAVAAATDVISPGPSTPVTIRVNGTPVTGVLGQTLAGVMLATNTLSWSTTAVHARARGAFCGIGVCFDCLVVVNGQPDVRACQRRASEGDVVEATVALPPRPDRG